MNSVLIPKLVYEYIPSGRRNKHNEGRTIRVYLLTGCCADDDDAECCCTVAVFYLYVFIDVVILLTATFSII
jgi:hypothetical protein